MRTLAAASCTIAVPGHPLRTSAAGQRRIVTIGGERARTIDVHAHTTIPEVRNLLNGTILEKAGAKPVSRWGDMLIDDDRIREMDATGIDVRVVSINPFWYSADRELARRVCDLQNAALAKRCARYPGRFFAYTTVALQFPELAAEQMKTGMNELGLKGASIAGAVQGQVLSDAKFDPFWAMAEALQAPIFMHPFLTADELGIAKWTQGDGVLPNVVGHPLETTLFLSHLIFGGVLDRFPHLKICCAHGGGFLPSYADRMDHGCDVFPTQCRHRPAKPPSEYLKQLYFDSLLFTPEAVRHLAATVGAKHIVLGTDAPIPWIEGSPVDPVLAAPGLTPTEQAEILGGNAEDFLGMLA